jgi:phosphoribosyl-AMP cyclohydrolase
MLFVNVALGGQIRREGDVRQAHWPFTNVLPNMMSPRHSALLDSVTFNDDGLIPAIAQDAETDRVLMMAYMTADTLRETLERGRMVYWSRSRQERWAKGETSGHTQTVEEVRLDCDGDALLFKVQQKGGACHTGFHSCFYRRAEGGRLVEDGKKIFDPGEVYDEA